MLREKEPVSKAHILHAARHITFSGDNIIELENKLVAAGVRVRGGRPGRRDGCVSKEAVKGSSLC